MAGPVNLPQSLLITSQRGAKVTQAQLTGVFAARAAAGGAAAAATSATRSAISRKHEALMKGDAILKAYEIANVAAQLKVSLSAKGKAALSKKRAKGALTYKGVAARPILVKRPGVRYTRKRSSSCSPYTGSPR